MKNIGRNNVCGQKSCKSLESKQKVCKSQELLELRSSLHHAVEFYHCTKQIKATALFSFHSSVQCVCMTVAKARVLGSHWGLQVGLELRTGEFYMDVSRDIWSKNSQSNAWWFLEANPETKMLTLKWEDQLSVWARKVFLFPLVHLGCYRIPLSGL